MSESSESMLRAEAIGVDSFPKASTDHVLRIEGIVAEERVDEAAVKKMEENYGLATQSHGAINLKSILLLCVCRIIVTELLSVRLKKVKHICHFIILKQNATRFCLTVLMSRIQ